MDPARAATHPSTITRHHRFKTLRTALERFTLGLRDLEEQLPLPTDRLVRDTTSARQKATALRVDIQEIDLRLLQLWHQLRSMSRIQE